MISQVLNALYLSGSDLLQHSRQYVLSRIPPFPFRCTNLMAENIFKAKHQILMQSWWKESHGNPWVQPREIARQLGAQGSCVMFRTAQGSHDYFCFSPTKAAPGAAAFVTIPLPPLPSCYATGSAYEGWFYSANPSLLPRKPFYFPMVHWALGLCFSI